VHLLASPVFGFPIIPDLSFFCCISLVFPYTQKLANGGLDLSLSLSLSLFFHLMCSRLTERSIPLAGLLQVLCCSFRYPSVVLIILFHVSRFSSAGGAFFVLLAFSLRVLYNSGTGGIIRSNEA
jgi:hypothetical protein